jgi:hypothetical protein
MGAVPPCFHSPSRKPVNARSVSIGLVGVLLLSVLTAYNDFAVNNTYLIGTYLPVGVMLFLLGLILGVNAPLRAWRPRWALGSGELAVVLAMMLAACAVPASGLMRYLPTHLVGVWWHAGQTPDYLEALRSLNLPDWLFPTFESTDLRERTNDPVVKHFFERAPARSDTFVGHLRAVPWAAWARPALAWGVFIAAVWGAILCLAVIVRRQWVENERLPFPIATIYLSLIEEPEDGRAVNRLFRSRSFWIAAGAVFLVHAVNALYQYDRQRFPQIPIGFDFTSLLRDEPWRFMDTGFKAARLYFTIVGLTFFLQSGVSFSLWFFYVLMNVVLLFAGPAGLSYADYNARRFIGGDQLFGALVPFVTIMLWVGRREWATVVRQMIGRPRAGDDPGKYLPYRVAGWGLVACAGVMVAWLTAAGTTVLGGLVTTVLMLTLYLVAARIVAETGLVFVQLNVPLNRPWVYLSKDLPAVLAYRTTLGNFFFGSMMTASLTHDVRENLAVFASQSLRVADEAMEDEDEGRSMKTENGGKRVSSASSFSLLPAIVLALVVAFVVSGLSFLYVEYTYANTLDRQGIRLNSPWGTDYSIRVYELAPTHSFRVHGGPNESHSRPGHFALGAGVTLALSLLRMRLTGWPLHPVGYLLMHTYVMEMIWFSVFVGWLVKVLLVRFGGASVFRGARVFFTGAIVGELFAAGFWLVVSLVLHALGYSYTAISLLPI